MVHALQEAHRVLQSDGLLLDLRPAAVHRRAGLGAGRRWRLVGVMREPFADDRAADRAVNLVIRQGLFHREARDEFILDRVMDSLQDFRAWLDDFSANTFPSHDWLYQRLERALGTRQPGTQIVVRGLVKLGVLRKGDGEIPKSSP